MFFFNQTFLFVFLPTHPLQVFEINIDVVDGRIGVLGYMVIIGVGVVTQ